MCLVLGTASCSRQEKDLFEKSAADRLHATEQAVRDNLTSAGNGWEMRYFPYPDLPGYALLAQFADNGTVKIAAKNSVSSNNTYQEEVSLWDMDGTQGCVLTFNSYNALFSIFADPLSDGVGYAGDYEFVVLKNETNTLYLKGKKHGAYVVFNRLSDTQNWKAYFDATDVVNNEIFTDNDGIDMTYWDGTKAIPVVYEEGTFTYLEDAEEIIRSFLTTPNGVHFYSGMPLANSTDNAKEFAMSADKQRLQTADGKAYFKSNYTPASYFDYRLDNESRWLYEAEGTDAKTRARVDSICNAAKALGAEITDFAYEQLSNGGSMVASRSYGLRITYTAEGKQFSGRINFYAGVDNDITFRYKSIDDDIKPLFTRLSGDQESVDGVAALFCSIFCDTFTPESYMGSALNLTQLKLNGKNSGSCIHIRAQRVIM